MIKASRLEISLERLISQALEVPETCLPTRQFVYNLCAWYSNSYLGSLRSHLNRIDIIMIKRLRNKLVCITIYDKFGISQVILMRMLVYILAAEKRFTREYKQDSINRTSVNTILELV